MIENHFSKEFDSADMQMEKPFVGMLRPDEGSSEAIQEKRLNLSSQYHGDLSGASLLAFAKGDQEAYESMMKSPKEIRFDRLGE